MSPTVVTASDPQGVDEPQGAGPVVAARRPWRRRIPVKPLVGPLALLAIVAFFGILYPTTFLTPTNLLTNVLETVSFVAIVAAAQTIVMVVGDFDLSVGGVAALATSFTAAIITTTTLSGTPQEPGSVLVAVLIGLAVGLAAGAISGVLVS